MEVHFNMSKLTREQKIEIYARRKNGETVSSLIKEFKIRSEAVNYIVSLIDFHGFDILRTDKNNYYSIMMKQEIIDKVLIDNCSIRSVALEYGLLSRGMLQKWICSYKKHGCVIVEKTKGKSSAMKKKNVIIKPYDEMDDKEKVKYNEDRIQYLEAENEYLKKLQAVVQARKNRQSKKE